MEKLKRDWLTEGLIDFEYKKYILLAYLKDIKKRFNQSELYPFMADLVFHYRNLTKVKENKELIFSQFPKTLSEADFDKLKLTYKTIMEDDEVMKEMEEIISYALPQIESTLQRGKELYEFVEENITLEPVGLMPIYSDEGYLLISLENSVDVSVYRYQLTLFEHAEEKYRNIAFNYLGNEIKAINRTYENIKLTLIKKHKELPNPATFVAQVKLSFPIPQTVLPVTKRMLVQEISLS